MSTQPSGAQTATEKMDPVAHLMQIMIGSLPCQASYVAAKLGIADFLKDGPRTVAQLAQETKTHERSLYRLLRSLASVGIFAETDSQTFTLTPPAELLLTDHPGSLRGIAIFMGEEWHWAVCGEMLYSVQTGKAAWEKVHGLEVFPYLQQNPRESEIFNRAMTSLSGSTLPAIVEAYDFTGVETLADIAGGHGILLAGFLKANPQLKGVLFDLPEVIEGAPTLLQAEGVEDRVRFESGDFFEGVTKGADAYMMKFIIHDWDDERALKILRIIQRDSAPSARLLLVEMVLPERNEPHFSKIQDLEMLVAPGGIERTEEEYRELLSESGFDLRRVIPTKSPLSIVEAFKK